MKIGIMGGTFNPIHNGHLSLAKAAYQQYPLDRIWFMPSGLPAHKSNQELLPAKTRLHMVQLALAGSSGFEASSFEIDREGFTYTADTMVALAKEYPKVEFYFIIGGDSLMKFHKWVKPEVISAHATLLAAGRDGISKDCLTEQAKQLKLQFGTKVSLLDMPELKISSNEIRFLCANKQYNEVKKLVPEPVVQYIMEHELWKYPTN